MDKGTKRINFTYLQYLVSDIDYILDCTYPVIFTVDGKRFACGITDTYIEQQYLATLDDNGWMKEILDLRDPDSMIYENVGRMLKKKCGIKADSKIWLNPNSFSGKHYGNEDYVLNKWKKRK